MEDETEEQRENMNFLKRNIMDKVINMNYGNNLSKQELE